MEIRKGLVRVVVSAAVVAGMMHLGDAKAAPSSNVRAEVTGIHSKKGNIGCMIYASAKGFPGDPASALRMVWLPIAYNTVTCDFPNLAPGTYAVAVMHDENGNGKMDTTFVGAPAEGYGSSNNVTHTFSAATWDEAKFEVKPGNTTTAKIALHY